MDAMAAIKQTFFQECEEQLGELETGLIAIQDGDSDPETVNAVFRAVHSIKGGAGAFNLDELVHFAHAFESVLDHLRAGRLTPSGEILKTMLRAADMLADLVRAARDGLGSDAGRRDALAAELRALDPDAEKDVDCAGKGSDDGDDGAAFVPLAISFDDLELESAPAENYFIIRFSPKPDLYAKANETALLIRELGRLGETAVTCDFTRLPMLDELDPEGSYLSWTIELRTDQDEAAVRAVFEFVEWDCELEIERGTAAREPDDAGLEALIEKMQATVEAKLAAREAVPAAVQATAAEVLPEPEGNAAQAFGGLTGSGSRKPASRHRPRSASISIASIV